MLTKMLFEVQVGVVGLVVSAVQITHHQHCTSLIKAGFSTTECTPQFEPDGTPIIKIEHSTNPTNSNTTITTMRGTKRSSATTMSSTPHNLATTDFGWWWWRVWCLSSS
eukprot:c8682_g1_i4.p4 GENE.c8682_g1_i4~~c8682_g1_i4.p4  ORF type:complete len:109 (-),score=39.45 c8682_g1_i4:97-423(-)